MELVGGQRAVGLELVECAGRGLTVEAGEGTQEQAEAPRA